MPGTISATRLIYIIGYRHPKMLPASVHTTDVPSRLDLLLTFEVENRLSWLFIVIRGLTLTKKDYYMQ